MQQNEYAGFWIRVGASLIDTLLLLLIIYPVLYLVYGPSYFSSDTLIVGRIDFLLNYIFPAIVVILFWKYRSATPGKMAVKLSIVDAKTGKKPSSSQFVIRYLGYFIAAIPLFIGIIWVGIDQRKQGWHDKIAGTVVLRDVHPIPVEFES